MLEKANKLRSRDNFINEKLNVIKNQMLGSINNNGEYVVSPKVSKELVALHKTCKMLTDKENVYCSALTRSGKVYDFYMKVKEYPLKKTSVARLYLVESMSEYSKKKNKSVRTKIAKYTDYTTDHFLDNALSYYNISVKNVADLGQEYKEEVEADIDKTVSTKNIDFRQASLEVINKKSGGYIDNMYQQLFKDKFLYLRNHPSPYAKEILRRVFEEAGQDTAFYFKDYNKRILNYETMYELMCDQIYLVDDHPQFKDCADKHHFLDHEHKCCQKYNLSYDGYTSDFSSNLGTIADFFEDVVDAFKSEDSLFDKIGDSFRDFKENVKDFGESVKDFFCDIFNIDNVNEQSNMTAQQANNFVTELGLDGSYKQMTMEAYGGMYNGGINKSFTDLETTKEYNQTYVDKHQDYLYKNNLNKDMDEHLRRTDNIAWNQNDYDNNEIQPAMFEASKLNPYKVESDYNATLNNTIQKLNQNLSMSSDMGMYKKLN